MRRLLDLRSVLVGLVPLLAGCALERGRGFATLDTATLEISLESASSSGDGSISTDRGYDIVIDQATLSVSRLELQERGSEPMPDAEHDHEHDEADHDEAEHGADETAYFALVTLNFREPISIVDHAAVAADRYQPSRELARSTPERALVAFSHLELAGSVSGGDFGDDSLALLVDLPLDTELAASFEPVEIDQQGPESVHLSTAVSIAETWFDGIDLAALAADGSVVIDDPDAALAMLLSTKLGSSEIHASLE